MTEYEKMNFIIQLAKKVEEQQKVVDKICDEIRETEKLMDKVANYKNPLKVCMYNKDSEQWETVLSSSMSAFRQSIVKEIGDNTLIRLNSECEVESDKLNQLEKELKSHLNKKGVK